jgi:hypothetical protein
MKTNFWLLIILSGSITLSCDKPDEVGAVKVVESDFESSTDGWIAEFTEYYEVQGTDIFEFDSKLAFLPTPLDTKRQAFMIQSHNRSDDIFMFLKRKVTGLEPNRTYKLTFELDLGTTEPLGYAGIGGAPAESVYVKVGASPNEPLKKLVDGFYEVTIDKGNQSTNGTEMIGIGDVGNGTETPGYKLVQRSNADKPISVNSDQNGDIWLCVGTDSGYEGQTILYYDRIKVTIAE